MALQAIDPTKPILGYSLKQRIGAGGYGEVWAAEAPGGLPKAVKFIFGFHDEKRAQTELKALNRIREVRHPFLLSLERIDIVEDQMVVITELADMCLKTRFGQCVDSGLNGIPRAELLGYLRDAANALDFISDEFGLQHLDVKPENLLLLSGHIKVADFGLVKDLKDVSQSMMSGLTPAYAPPEVFDGRPSLASDQYSLAVVFQEMLTGVRPFDGTTAAQLASQHIKERPNLKPLPRDDQATVSRAMSKDPELRFPSCEAFVDALSVEKTRQSAPQPRTRAKLRDGKNKKRRRRSATSTFSVTEGTRPFAISETQTTKLSRLEYDVRSAKFRATLFIGLGNAGTQIVRQVRHRLNTRCGQAAELPAIKFLCIDTDTSDLRDACLPDVDGRLTRRETFELPLRRPEEYRNDARMHLAWLSRRWIYNVPKSLRTEGIRPLGRLAMATHIEDLAVRLRQVLSELVHAEHLGVTAETLELDPVTQPRVVIVGSISGGTCSGMGIDLAYIVRSILRQLSATNEEVIGIFTHSSTARSQRRELSIANSLAFLNELYHFSCVEEYPGDESCGIPASTDGTTTFASTYLSHLGDDLDESTYQEELDSIAEYLYLGTVTPCASFFDNCRTDENESLGLPLRTLGLTRSSRTSDKLITSAAELLHEQVVRDWTAESNDKSFNSKEIAAGLLHEFSATANQMACLANEMLIRELKVKAPVESVSQLLMQQVATHDHEQRARRVAQTAAGLCGLGQAAGDPPAKFSRLLDSFCQQFADDRIPKITRCILSLVDRPGPRISAVEQVTREVTQHLVNQANQIEAHCETISRQIAELTRTLAQPLPKENLSRICVELAECLLQRFTYDAVRRLSKSLMPVTEIVAETVERLKDQLTLVTEPNDASAEAEAHVQGSSPAAKFEQRVLDRLNQRLPKLSSRVEQQLQHNLLDLHGGLRAVLEDADLRYQLRDHLCEATRATIVEQLKEISLESNFSEDLDSGEIAKWMVKTAMPGLYDCGGAVRWMHAYPQRDKPIESFVQDLTEAAEQQPTLIPATVGELVSCIEVERVPLDNVAMRLLQNRPDSIEFASRLHTRTDISWTHISSMR